MLILPYARLVLTSPLDHPGVDENDLVQFTNGEKVVPKDVRIFRQFFVLWSILVCREISNDIILSTSPKAQNIC